MYLLLIKREVLLRFLPQGGVAAEIGVAKGAFSAQILENASPSHLHLIDPWQEMDDDYAKDPNNRPQAEADARHDDVRRQFAEQIQNGSVTIHRQTSMDALNSFDDKYFDWVYIDGNHTRDAVLEDLRGYLPKVKDDGFILGHDYTNHPGYLQLGFGVVEAVNEFVAENKLVFLVLTMEGAPTYLLCRDFNAPSVQQLVGSLMQTAPLLEIRDFPERDYFHKRVQMSDGSSRDFLSF